MNKRQEKLLRDFANGKAQTAVNEQEFGEFKALVEDYLELERYGFIEILDLKKESYTGHRHYAVILPRITDEGRVWLSDNKE